jgi:DNA mismatch repair protein MutS
VGNAQVLVEETGDDLVFLHRVSRGGASRSYGIEAARLAGVPAPVVLRARQVLSRIEANSHVAVGIGASAEAAADSTEGASKVLRAGRRRGAAA